MERLTGTALAVVALVLGVSASAAERAPNDRNWIALNIWDGIYPLLEEHSAPEGLMALEIIESVYARRQLGRQISDLFGGKPGYGNRSSQGHYMFWLHFSDHFVRERPWLRERLGNDRFMYGDRDTDVFTGWSGMTNLMAFLREGIRGLAAPVVIDPDTGRLSGNLQGFGDAVATGDADYEAGFFLTDDQAERAVEAFTTYAGHGAGYSFLRSIEEKPNAPYEPAGAQLVNGYNCGDFAFHVLTSSGAVPRWEVERLKIRFWYPERYLNQPIPLREVGAKGFEWMEENPDATFFPGNVMMKLAWADLLFKPRGLTFFDTAALAREIQTEGGRVVPARIWDHVTSMEWLRENAEFRAKGIVTELLPAVKAGLRIVSPVRTVLETPDNRWRASKDAAKWARWGERYMRRKLKHAGIPEGEEQMAFRRRYESLKDYLE
ncbi:MAG: hypothetical protein IT285_11110 [Bdellovibrionales bacterium]|nr:hypothetical protein [Bdellovibrionales bacterium]